MRFPRAFGRLYLLLLPLALSGGLLLNTNAPSAASPSMSVVWRRDIAPPTCLAMSAGARFVGYVGEDSKVRFISGNGQLLWTQLAESATDLLIAANGESLLTFSKSNPDCDVVYFFRGNGSRLWRHHVKGQVWAGTVSADGENAAVTTDNRYLYVYRPDPGRPTYRRWRLDGAGQCLTFIPDGRGIAVGTWQQAGLVCYDLKGNFMWRTKLSGEGRYELRASSDGRTIMGLVGGTSERPETKLSLWEIGGRLLVRRSVKGFDATALVSPDSRYVALSYATHLPHQKAAILERRVAVYSSDGRKSWEKGGLFFGPRLLALSPTGESVIVSDGEKSLYNMNEKGKILSKLTLGGRIQKSICTDDGSRLLVYCSNGMLYLIKVG